MTDEEHKELLADFKKFAKEVNSSKASAQQFLIDCGIHDENGKLSEHYNPETLERF